MSVNHCSDKLIRVFNQFPQNSTQITNWIHISVLYSKTSKMIVFCIFTCSQYISRSLIHLTFNSRSERKILLLIFKLLWLGIYWTPVKRKAHLIDCYLHDYLDLQQKFDQILRMFSQDWSNPDNINTRLIQYLEYQHKIDPILRMFSKDWSNT